MMKVAEAEDEEREGGSRTQETTCSILQNKTMGFLVNVFSHCDGANRFSYLCTNPPFVHE